MHSIPYVSHHEFCPCADGLCVHDMPDIGLPASSDELMRPCVQFLPQDRWAWLTNYRDNRRTFYPASTPKPFYESCLNCTLRRNSVCKCHCHPSMLWLQYGQRTYLWVEGGNQYIRHARRSCRPHVRKAARCRMLSSSRGTCRCNTPTST